MRILIGALFILLASSASAHAAPNPWTVGTGVTGAQAAKAVTTRSGQTFEVGVYCYDPQTPFIYLTGFPFPTGASSLAQIYIDGQRHFEVPMAMGAGAAPQGPAVAPMVREMIVGYEMQVQMNGETVDFSLIRSARSMRSALRNCFIE